MVAVLTAAFLMYFFGTGYQLLPDKFNRVIENPFFHGSAVVFILSVFSWLLIWQYVNSKKLIRINNELLVTNQSFERAEKIAGMGNWRYTFRTGETSFSDNFYSLINLQPGSKPVDLQFWLSIVSPEDKQVVIRAFKEALQDHRPFVISYKLVLNNNTVKYFKSIGEIITDNNGEKHLIGINLDVTDIVNYNKQLEIKNRKLELYNADLASFNYVASHDLQAPLRKIQMFISRIYEMEASVLSERGREFLNRIHASASQMQTLINDLLMFSRTNASNKRYEKTDLNIILNNAMDELSEVIKEKKAVIKSETLPVVDVIEYQIQQLFINLLSNSLKFSKKDIDVTIKVTCSVITRKKLGKLVVLDEEYPHDKYYAISIVDNGIGFDKEYSQKVFQLLFRLHDKAQYPGTGIGLAICKKIVDNHMGYIWVDSTPGDGAQFVVFLPKNLN